MRKIIWNLMALLSPVLFGVVLYLLAPKPVDHAQEECGQRLLDLAQCQDRLGMCSTDEVILFRKMSRCTGFAEDGE